MIAYQRTGLRHDQLPTESGFDGPDVATLVREANIEGVLDELDRQLVALRR